MENKTNRFEKFALDVGGHRVNKETFRVCGEFMFYVALFEERLFNDEDRQNPQNTERVAEDLAKTLNLSNYDRYGDYFCDRYLNDKNEGNTLFNNLRLGNNQTKAETALRSFKENKTRDKELLFAYLMIAYRFRNNMFHGSKRWINLNDYKEQFELLNGFFDKLLRDINNIGYKGFNK